jgi:purine-nucleoside phosphorylase
MEGEQIMSELVTLTQVDEIANAIRARISYRPRVGLILGSGLGSLAAAVEQATIIPVNELPAWPVSTVEGHQVIW